MANKCSTNSSSLFFPSHVCPHVHKFGWTMCVERVGGSEVVVDSFV